jgi:CBS domain-containing protein
VKKEKAMIAKECMTKSVELVTPDMTITEVAQKMRDGNFGICPVQKDDRLVGMLSDRDIAIRCVAEKRDCNNIHVGEIMTDKVLYCFEDEDVNEIAKNFSKNQVRRLPVLNRDKRLVGIISMGDISHSDEINSQQFKNSEKNITKPS